jgi:hypothetical protein
MRSVKITVKSTGEVLDFNASSPEQIVEAWRLASEYEKAYKALKGKLKAFVPDLVETNGLSEPINGYSFRLSNIQRMNYDKAVLREVFDEDTLDLFLKPDKPAIDTYLKENLETVGEGSTRLRKAMIPEGKPYQVIKLEKLS